MSKPVTNGVITRNGYIELILNTVTRYAAMTAVYILIGLAVLVAIFLIIVAMQPAEFTIVRSTKIAASPSKVFPLVNNLRMWQLWSPWEKLDPQMNKVYEGSDEGAGATYAWNGNNKVGEGRITILDSKPSDQIDIRLDFIRPFKATNDVEFTFKPEGNATNVTWKMDGRNSFMAKAFCMFMNMDKMVGADFEKGLAAMKAEAEKGKP